MLPPMPGLPEAPLGQVRPAPMPGTTVMHNQEFLSVSREMEAAMKGAASGSTPDLTQLQAMQARIAGLMNQYDPGGAGSLPAPGAAQAQAQLASPGGLAGGLQPNLATALRPPLAVSALPLAPLPSLGSAALPPLPAAELSSQDAAWLTSQKADLNKAEEACKLLGGQRGCFVGAVARWSETLGIGHIECKEAALKYGGDVQIFRDAFGDLKVSDTVLFQVAPHTGQGGGTKAPCARRVTQLTEQRRRILQVEVPCPQPGAEGPQEYLGFITSFGPSAGFGFISCAQTRQMYGAEVYIHYDQYFDKNVGDAVHFKAALNSKGVPVARCVRKAVGGGDPDKIASAAAPLGATVAAPAPVKTRSRSRSMSESMSISGERKDGKRDKKKKKNKDRSKSRSRSRRRKRRSRS